MGEPGGHQSLGLAPGVPDFLPGEGRAGGRVTARPGPRGMVLPAWGPLLAASAVPEVPMSPLKASLRPWGSTPWPPRLQTPEYPETAGGQDGLWQWGSCSTPCSAPEIMVKCSFRKPALRSRGQGLQRLGPPTPPPYKEEASVNTHAFDFQEVTGPEQKDSHFGCVFAVL